MSDIDESVHVGTKATNIKENSEKGAETGVQIRSTVDEGLAIWYISQYSMVTNGKNGTFVSQCVDKLCFSE